MFGVAIAAALNDQNPEHIVYLITSPNPSITPASKGIARIMREGYGVHEQYADLACESIRQMTDGPLKDFYHPHLWCVLEPGKQAFEDIKLDGSPQEYDSQPAGWIEAAPALEHKLGMSVDCGVIRLSQGYRPCNASQCLQRSEIDGEAT